MTLPVEHWDLYNTQHEHVGIIRRGMEVPEGFYHIAVEVIPTDLKGHLLITRRSLEKKFGAGKYEFPAGSVLAGEKPTDAAVRELWEETGLVPENLIPLQKKTKGTLQRRIYIAVIPDLLEKKIKLQERETIGYKFVTLNEWLEMRRQNYMEKERVDMYSAEMYAYLEKNIGSPEESKTSAPCDVKPTGFHRVDARNAFSNHHADAPKIAACHDQSATTGVPTQH